MNWEVYNFETISHISGGRRIVYVTYKHTNLSIYRYKKEVW